VEKRKKLLVLGSRGRLGWEFINRHAKIFDIIEVGSTERPTQGGRDYYSDISSLDELFLGWRPEIILNLAAAWGPRYSEGEIWEACYAFPSRVLALLDKQTHTIQWIQVDSYYNLYFDLHGVDKDDYSRSKRIFFEYLEQKNSLVAPTQVIAPHLVGPSEPENRFFRVLSDGIFRQKPYFLGSRDKYLPYLHFSDAADQLSVICQSPISRSPTRLNLKTSGQDKISHIVSHAHRQFGVPENIAQFRLSPEVEREFFSPLSFDKNEWLPEPKQGLSSILKEQLDERIGEKESRS
jgi:nucleoside-diphosphate-sugar epimerase